MKKHNKNSTKAFLISSFLALSFNLYAGNDMKDLKDITAPDTVDNKKDWSLEFGSGTLISNVRTSNAGYTIVPIDFTASLTLDEISNDKFLDGAFRGYTEFFFRGNYSQIIHGPETHYEGITVGPRYNFVQPGWKIIPYIEAGVGVAFADARADKRGLGQDFNFTFTTGAGFKYLINDTWFTRLGVDYQHISNAGLSEPASANNAIDALGPKITFGTTF